MQFIHALEAPHVMHVTYVRVFVRIVLVRMFELSRAGGPGAGGWGGRLWGAKKPRTSHNDAGNKPLRSQFEWRLLEAAAHFRDLCGTSDYLQCCLLCACPKAGRLLSHSSSNLDPLELVWQAVT